jgi:hypothetical protein
MLTSTPSLPIEPLSRASLPDDQTNPLYDVLFDVLFGSVRHHPEGYDDPFLTTYDRLSNDSVSAQGSALHSFPSRYCERRLRPVPQYLAIDTGVHGNMPLLLMTTSPRIKDFRMYTCVPWLQDFFGAAIFTRLSTTMRYVEALVCQEDLFYFSAVEEDKILIKETQDAYVRAAAYGEIRSFLRDSAKDAQIARFKEHVRQLEDQVRSLKEENELLYGKLSNTQAKVCPS